MVKKIKKAGSIFAVVLAVSSLSVSASAKSDEAEKLQEGQRVGVIRVVSITGNELTYYEVEETENETSDEKKVSDENEASEENVTSEKKEAAEEKKASGSTDPELETDAGNGESNSVSGKMEQGDLSSGKMPQRDSDSGQMPQEDFTPGQTSQSGLQTGRMGSDLEMTTVYLPVAVIVHTDTGENRNFTILEAGDELEVQFEKDADGEEIITEIWMENAEGRTK